MIFWVYPTSVHTRVESDNCEKLSNRSRFFFNTGVWGHLFGLSFWDCTLGKFAREQTKKLFFLRESSTLFFLKKVGTTNCSWYGTNMEAILICPYYFQRHKL